MSFLNYWRFFYGSIENKNHARPMGFDRVTGGELDQKEIILNYPPLKKRETIADIGLQLRDFEEEDDSDFPDLDFSE